MTIGDMDTPALTWDIDVSSFKGFLECNFEASAQELHALAAYAGVAAVHRLSAAVKVHPGGPDRYRVSGRYTAAIVQLSVITLEPVGTEIREEFDAQFWPAELIPVQSGEQDAALDLPEPLSNGKIGIGALLCELLALAADPYPKNSGETLDWVENGDDASGPFAALKALGRRTPDVEDR